jgi:hypothetical protein
MNLDDMKNDWQARDLQLQQSIQLNTRWLREAFIDRRSAGVRRWALFGFWVELPAYLVTIGALALFIAHHIGEPRFAIPAVLMLAWSGAMFGAIVRQLEAMRRIDFSEPVIAVQKRLTALRMTRLKTFKWAFLSGMFVWWILLLIVAFKAVLDLDLYAMAPRFIASQIAGTAALAGALIWIAKRYSSRLQRSKFVTPFLDGIAGKDLAVARAFLQKLSSFEQGEPLN